MSRLRGISVSLLLLLLTGCQVPTNPDLELEISDKDFAASWKAMVPRTQAWFAAQGLVAPQLPSWRDAQEHIRIYQANVPTCDTDGSSRIRVGPGNLKGCLPHELGHVALKMAHNQCWAIFEHQGERCQ